MITNKEILHKAAKTSENAYSIYSDFPAGACCVYESGGIYTGCNIENASYGLSLCAERNAMASAIAAGEQSRLIKIAVYSPAARLCFPCGACRQWIKEFAKGYNTEIILEGNSTEPVSFYIDDLLPYPFSLS